jgi:hypothetical protein
MFDSERKSKTPKTVALLAAAFIFIPLLLLMSRPFGYISLGFAIACSAICVVMAVVPLKKSWKKSSQPVA